MSRYFNEGFDAMGGEALEHANKPHKYIERVRTKSGKWRYIYKTVTKAGSKLQNRVNGVATSIPDGEARNNLGAAYDGRGEMIRTIGNAGHKVAKASRTLQQVRTPNKSSTLGVAGKVPEFGVAGAGKTAKKKRAKRGVIVDNSVDMGVAKGLTAAKGVAKKNAIGAAKATKKKKEKVLRERKKKK